MGATLKLFNSIALVIFSTLIYINDVRAEAPNPLLLHGSYALTYGKLPIGKVDVHATQTASAFEMQADASLVGVAKIFSSHHSNNKVSGTLNPAEPWNFTHAKREFQTDYSSNEGERTIILGYDAAGKLIKEQVPDTYEMSYRPKIPAVQKDGVADTMTMVFVLRDAIYNARQTAAETSVKYFDGKRLSKVNVQVYGVVTRNYAGTPIRVWKIGLTREAIAGHTEKEIKRLKAMKQILIYLTDDADFKPVLGDLPTTFGTFHAELKYSHST